MIPTPVQIDDEVRRIRAGVTELAQHPEQWAEFDSAIVRSGLVNDIFSCCQETTIGMVNRHIIRPEQSAAMLTQGVIVMAFHLGYLVAEAMQAVKPLSGGAKHAMASKAPPRIDWARPIRRECDGVSARLLYTARSGFHPRIVAFASPEGEEVDMLSECGTSAAYSGRGAVENVPEGAPPSERFKEEERIFQEWMREGRDGAPPGKEN